MRTEDGSIIHRCLDGKPGAFGILVDKYKAGIYAYVYTELRDLQDAQDVTQEVFIQAYRDLRSLRRWESFAFWLHRIAYRRCMDFLRIRSRRVDREFTEDQDPKAVDAPSLDSYRRNQLTESVWEALDALPEIYREVLILHYFGGMTIKDIASAIGASPSAIGKRLSRARAQLKEEMIAMMDTAFEGHKLQASFTFRIIEMLKRIKIHATPRSTGLPWGLSLAAGIAIVVMTLGSQMTIYKQPIPLAFPGETETLKVREMSVDILSGPQTSVMAGKQGHTDGAGIDRRSPENTSLLAPAKGGGTWTQKADMPTERYVAGSAVVDGKIYVIGGSTGSRQCSAAVEEYDPTTDTWTKRADMPTGRGWLSTSAVNGIIYAIGGWSEGIFFSVVEAYDPAADKWTRKADMPTRREPCTVTVDGRIYAIGGLTGRQGMPVTVSTVEVYDPATDTWTRKADMPTARWYHAACVIDGRIYVSGGDPAHSLVDPAAVAMPTVEVYDPATDTWTQASDMPWPRYGHSASVLGGKMYIIGGGNQSVARRFAAGEITLEELSELFESVDVYDPKTDTWTKAASGGGAMGHAAAVVDGRIYTIGGWYGSSSGPVEFTIVSRVDEFDPGLPGSLSTVSPAGKLLETWGQVKKVQ